MLVVPMLPQGTVYFTILYQELWVIQSHMYKYCTYQAAKWSGVLPSLSVHSLLQ